MIDWLRVLDSPAFFSMAVGVALLVGVSIGYGMSVALRTLTARHLAEQWFGEIQREVVRQNSIISQLEMANVEKNHKIAGALGLTQTMVDVLRGSR